MVFEKLPSLLHPEKKLRVIGLCGLAGSGKDTVGNHLVKEWGYTRFAFADAVKEALLVFDPWIEVVPKTNHLMPSNMAKLSQLVEDEGWDVAKQRPEVRQVLLDFGIKVGREYLGSRLSCGNVWVDLAEEYIYKKLCEDPDIKFVITDVRFEDEGNLVKDFGGILVKVEREYSGLKGENAKHESEAVPFTPDFTVVNNGSIRDLQDLVENWLIYGNPQGEINAV